MQTNPLLFILLNCIRPMFVDETHNRLDPRTVAVPMSAIYGLNKSQPARMTMHNPDFETEESYTHRLPTYGLVPVVNGLSFRAVAVADSISAAQQFIRDVKVLIADVLESKPYPFELDNVSMPNSQEHQATYPIIDGQVDALAMLVWAGGALMQPFMESIDTTSRHILVYQFCFVHPENTDMLSEVDLQASRVSLKPVSILSQDWAVLLKPPWSNWPCPVSSKRAAVKFRLEMDCKGIVVIADEDG
jgi:hypothetical protein